MRSSKKIKAITFSGICIALIVVMLFMASIVDILDYTISAICGIVVTFILIEFGMSYAVLSYAGASILGLILVPNKINAILFVAFCGWYPFVKRYLERLPEIFCLITKFAVFNISLAAIYFVSKAFFPFEGSTKLLVAMYLLCNVTFFLYDTLITKLIWLYVHKYRKLFKILK